MWLGTASPIKTREVIFAEGALTESGTCKDYLQVRQEGARQVERNLRHYNLVAILAVGYPWAGCDRSVMRTTTARLWRSLSRKR